MWDLFLSAVDRTASCALNVFWWPLNSLLCFCFPDLTQWPAPPPVRVHLPLDMSEYTKCCKFKATAGEKCRKYFSQCSCSASTRLERAVRDSSLFLKNRHENPLAIARDIYTIFTPTSGCAFSDRFSPLRNLSAKTTTGNFETILGGNATQKRLPIGILKILSKLQRPQINNCCNNCINSRKIRNKKKNGNLQLDFIVSNRPRWNFCLTSPEIDRE